LRVLSAHFVLTDIMLIRLKAWNGKREREKEREKEKDSMIVTHTHTHTRARTHAHAHARTHTHTHCALRLIDSAKSDNMKSLNIHTEVECLSLSYRPFYIIS